MQCDKAFSGMRREAAEFHQLPTSHHDDYDLVVH
jgi:hypothetical protein